MTDRRYESWGRYPNASQTAHELVWRDEPLPKGASEETTFLPFGNGRSYGDVCLNDGGDLIDGRGLDHFIRFDSDTGLLRCEAGVLLESILELCVPRGWFLPVTPGTQFVTVGGAIANDVHGKNHHDAGTFGRHLCRFELLRSDGTRLMCSSYENTGYYQATIGGLGLTGFITWAEIQLRKINNAYIEREVIRYGNLNEFFSLARESNEQYEHTVAWVDCLAKKAKLGRGLFMRGNHSENVGNLPRPKTSRRIHFPIDPPFALINGPTLKLLNSVYYRKQWAEKVTATVHYESFFYPLDKVHGWNRIYGAKGFLQYQCVVPGENAEDSIRETLTRIAKAGVGSFLAVLKLLGDKPSPGLLSFPMPGATLALDFPNDGVSTLRLLDDLDDVTTEAGGRVYPAKDARMRHGDFQKNYPSWDNFQAFIDPRFSSSFWRRVTIQP